MLHHHSTSKQVSLLIPTHTKHPPSSLQTTAPARVQTTTRIPQNPMPPNLTRALARDTQKPRPSGHRPSVGRPLPSPPPPPSPARAREAYAHRTTTLPSCPSPWLCAAARVPPASLSLRPVPVRIRACLCLAARCGACEHRSTSAQQLKQQSQRWGGEGVAAGGLRSEEGRAVTRPAVRNVTCEDDCEGACLPLLAVNSRWVGSTTYACESSASLRRE